MVCTIFLFKSFSERIIHVLKFLKLTTHEIAPVGAMLQFCTLDAKPAVLREESEMRFVSKGVNMTSGREGL